MLNFSPNHITDYIFIYLYLFLYIYIYLKPDIGLAVRVFANGPGDLGGSRVSRLGWGDGVWKVFSSSSSLSSLFGLRVALFRLRSFNARSSHTKDSKKWYLMPPCLTLSIIRYGSRVKSSNPGKGVAPSPTPGVVSYRKGSLRVTLDYGRQLYLLIYLYIFIMAKWHFVEFFSQSYNRLHFYIFIYIYILIMHRALLENYMNPIIESLS